MNRNRKILVCVVLAFLAAMLHFQFYRWGWSYTWLRGDPVLTVFTSDSVAYGVLCNYRDRDLAFWAGAVGPVLILAAGAFLVLGTKKPEEPPAKPPEEAEPGETHDELEPWTEPGESD